MLSCNCLNIVIEPKQSDFQQVTVASLNLSEEEKENLFFKQDIKKIPKPNCAINMEHSGLVVSKNTGSWTSYQCLNCDVYTHAIHQDKKVSFLLISANLLAAPKIAVVRTNKNFSNIFGILIHTRKEKYEDVILPKNVPADVELALKSVKQHVSEVISKEIANTEDRVRQFTEKQYLLLEKFRERANKEHNTLARVILDKRNRDLVSPSGNSLELQYNSSRLLNANVPVLTANTNLPSDKVRNKILMKAMNNSNQLTTNKAATQLTYNDSFTMDDELFQLDEVQDSQQLPFKLEDEDSESEVLESSRNEVGHIGRSKNQTLNMAKSLPMNIPAFMSSFRNRHPDDDQDDVMSEEHPSDIAASIKALAKSVHGDTVFGDLPRPRFSTQI